MSSADQRDEAISILDVPLRDAGAEGGHHEKTSQSSSTRSAESIAKDLNSATNELKTEQQGITPEFIANSTREELHIKEQELNTLIGVYRRDYDELIEYPGLSQPYLTTLKAHKAATEGYIGLINSAFRSSRFERASAQVKSLDALATKVENGRAGITADYLLVATPESLELSNKNHEKAYSEYLTAFSAINVAHLTTSENAALTAQKLKIDRTNESIKKFFADEITRVKGVGGIDTVDPKVGAASTSSSDREKESQIRSTIKVSQDGRILLTQGDLDALMKQQGLVKKASLDEVTQKLSDAESKARNEIRSLEKKLADHTKSGIVREDSQFSGVFIEDGAEGGHELQQTERAIVQLKLDAIQLPFFSGDLTTWEAFRDLFDQLVDKSNKLSDTVKFHQLRSHLKGVAFDTIRGLELPSSME